MAATRPVCDLTEGKPARRCTNLVRTRLPWYVIYPECSVGAGAWVPPGALPVRAGARPAGTRALAVGRDVENPGGETGDTMSVIATLRSSRAAVASMSARLATLNAPDAEIGKLRHLFDSFQNSPPSEHIDEYSDANIAFHQMIIRLGGSRLIEEATKNLFLHVRAIRRATISQNNRAARSIIEHLKIIEALERRDTELAERLTRQHTLDLAAHVDRYCDFLD